MCKNKNKHSGGVSCSACNTFIMRFILCKQGVPLVKNGIFLIFFTLKNNEKQPANF